MTPTSEVVGVCTCQACNHPYETDMLVPDDVWEVIKPEGCDIGGGLLCPTCIMDRAADRLGWTVGFVYPERHGTAVTAGKAATSEIVARYAFERLTGSVTLLPCVRVDGEWVRYADHAALISSLVAERDEALQLVNYAEDISKTIDARAERALARTATAETQLAALTKRVGELEGALEEAKDALVAAEVRDDNARFRANSPRQDAEVKHLRASAIVRARRLTGGEG